jgi:glycosyltransferase, family 8
MIDLIKDRDVALICGKGILNDIKYNPFDLCKSIEYIEAPNISAFSEYDSILEKAKKISKDKLICIILGPTADLLVYDLFKDGYQAWDIGHFVKDYDAYHKKNPRTADTLIKFYQPD